jgi:hypothetical protein
MASSTGSQANPQSAVCDQIGILTRCKATEKLPAQSSCRCKRHCIASRTRRHRARHQSDSRPSAGRSYDCGGDGLAGATTPAIATSSFTPIVLVRLAIRRQRNPQKAGLPGSSDNCAAPPRLAPRHLGQSLAKPSEVSLRCGPHRSFSAQRFACIAAPPDRFTLNN